MSKRKSKIVKPDRANSARTNGRSVARRGWIALAGVGIIVAVAVIVFYMTAPRPPNINLDDVDPMVAQAIREQCQLVSQSPRSGEAWGRLAMTLDANDFENLADQCFIQAERFEPKNPLWPYLHGAFNLYESPHRGLPLLQKAVELSGDEPPALRLRYGELLVETGSLEEAETQFRRILARRPNDARALLGMARLGFARSDKSEVIRDYLERSIGQQPTRQAHQLLATVQYRQGEPQAAAKEQRLAERLPKKEAWPDPYLEIEMQYKVGLKASLDQGHALRRAGRTTDAIEVLEKTSRAYPESPKVWGLLGEVYAQAGNLSPVNESYNHEPTQSGAPPIGGQGVGFARAPAMDPKRAALSAIGCFEKTLRLEPNNPEARNDLGSMLKLVGRGPEAIAHFEESLRIKPNNGGAHFNLALEFQEAGKLAEATKHYKEAVRLKPDFLPALNNLAWIRATHADPNFRDGGEAVRLAERAGQLTGRKQAEVLDSLAAAYAEAGRFEDAVTTAEEGVALANSLRQKELSNEIQTRLGLYRKGQPFRESPP